MTTWDSDRPDQLLQAIEDCRACGLRAGSTRVVPGEGDLSAKLMFIGEGPGADEDRTGRPFVGRAGELLTRMIAAIGMDRSEVYICNAVKCRPPQNRTPTEEEVAACHPFLEAQRRIVRPRVTVLLGGTAGRAVLGEDFRGVRADRGKWFFRDGSWILPTYHPSALLRDETLKRAAWEDFKAARDKLAAILGEEKRDAEAALGND